MEGETTATESGRVSPSACRPAASCAEIDGCAQAEYRACEILQSARVEHATASRTARLAEAIASRERDRNSCVPTRRRRQEYAFTPQVNRPRERDSRVRAPV